MLIEIKDRDGYCAINTDQIVSVRLDGDKIKVDVREGAAYDTAHIGGLRQDSAVEALRYFIQLVQMAETHPGDIGYGYIDMTRFQVQ